MALIDRVQARIETDIAPDELQLMIDEILAEIEDRYGASADPDNPVAITVEGLRRKLDLVRPMDVAQDVAIVEHIGRHHWDTTVQTLATDDWLAWNGGRTLERLNTGTHPRIRWGHRVDVEYVPINDGNQREEVVIKLVQLNVEYEGVIERQVGDVRTTHGPRSPQPGQSALGYQEERDHLLESLAPRKGIFLR